MPKRSPALDRAAAAGTRSGGRPPAGRREHRVRFWEAIARGASSVDAAAEAGVLPSIGVRWFRKGGGMPTLTLAPVSGRYLSFAEREEIAVLLARGRGVREIARQLGRAPSTISRELQRNSRSAPVGLSTGPRPRRRMPTVALDDRSRRSWRSTRSCVAMCRTGLPDPCSGPTGALRVRRSAGLGGVADRERTDAGDSLGARSRSRLDYGLTSPMMSRCAFPMRRSISRSMCKAAVRRELTACLRTGRALRVPRARTSRGNRSFVTDELLISERPAEVEDRAVPGHWEGDLILGTDRSAIGTLVERSSRFTMLLHLPPIEGHDSPTTKSSPPLTGAGAAAVRDAIADTITTLPEQLRRSLTWDQGSEMAQHVHLRLDTGLQIYFCDPRSPWQRGTNENTNGLLRQYFPKGTNLTRHSADELAAVAAALNGRPRKTLGWKTPAEVLTEYLSAAA